MGTPVLSASWYMVEHLRPRLRSHADIRRHVYRGEPWYVLEDPSAERYHRFSPEAYQVLVLLDGQRTMHEVWEQSCGLLGTEAPTQEQLIQLLAQMAQADVLHCDVPPDAAELIERQQRARNTEWKQQWLSPLFWKVRLFDPQPVVERLEHIVAPLFTRSAAVVWLLVVGLGAITAAQHWAELSEGVVDRVLSGGNLVVLSLLFPVLKTCHEFAHAFAVRRYGGEVHDMGVLFLVFMPLPFVDASAASGFKERRHRMVVGAAGILCELFIAACAMFVWVEAQPGLVRVIAFNTLFISGASTLLFNGNPLLRYDGYYILSDALEIPNLRGRATRYLRWLLERHLFGLKEQERPQSTAGERRWFVLYGCLSFVYRLLIMVGITLFVAQKFFFIGVALALWTVFSWICLPGLRTAWELLQGPRYRRVRGRAVFVSSAAASMGLALFAIVPMPLRTVSEGVVWIPEEAQLRTAEEGFVTGILAQEGASVLVGEELVILSNPSLVAAEKRALAALDELQARALATFADNVLENRLLAERIVVAEARASDASRRVRALRLRSPHAGTLHLPNAVDLPGRFLARGQSVGLVVPRDLPVVRGVVEQEQADLVNRHLDGVVLKPSTGPQADVPGLLVRQVPGAHDQLPSMALAVEGGGTVAVIPQKEGAMRAVQPLFHLEVIPADPASLGPVGSRVYIRFDHGWEPLVVRVSRALRQVFMERFGV